MADCGKRWEENPTCGSSLPKVVPSGYQQFPHLQKQIICTAHKIHQPTPPKVRSFSPGREKFEQLIEFKKRLDLQRKSTPQPGPSRSTPSSPKHNQTAIHTSTKVHASPKPDITETSSKEGTPASTAVGSTTHQTFTATSSSSKNFTLFISKETAAELLH